MKITNTLPEAELLKAENETKFKFAARRINSIEIKMLMIDFLLVKIPKTPIEKSTRDKIKKCAIGSVIGIIYLKNLSFLFIKYIAKNVKIILMYKI